MALDALYLDTILEHYRNPRNHGELDPCDGKARGHNPNCGDDVTVYLRLGGEVVEEVTFRGKGCAISLSAASMMTEAVKGRRSAEVDGVMAAFRDLMRAEEVEKAGETGQGGSGIDLGDLAVLQGVKQYPARIKCATLCWEALEEALEEAMRDVTE